MENEETIEDQNFAVGVVKIGAVCFVASAAAAVGWLAPFAVFAVAERRAAEKALREQNEITEKK
ncbi:MAG TPA: hypothetical protein PLN81_07945 [Bacillota bacterium]|jgi:hypothetical protein|nr:hypothetical protein [Bacillota bacterium]